MGFFDFFKNKSSDYENNNNNQRIYPNLNLIVDSAYPGDQGTGKVRIDPNTMLAMSVSPGDIIEIEGKNRTFVRVWRSLVEDWNQQKVRIDNFTRMNAGVELGEKLSLRKIATEIEANRVMLAPPEGFPIDISLVNNPQISKVLIDFPVTKNDIIPICFGMPFPMPMVGFKVMELEPDDAVIISKNTLIEFSNDLISLSEKISPLNEETGSVNQFGSDHDQNAQYVDNYAEDPLKIIKIRYAKGEISKAEYEEMEQVLKK